MCLIITRDDKTNLRDEGSLFGLLGQQCVIIRPQTIIHGLLILNIRFSGTVSTKLLK